MPNASCQKAVPMRIKGKASTYWRSCVCRDWETHLRKTAVSGCSRAIGGKGHRGRQWSDRGIIVSVSEVCKGPSNQSMV